MTPPTQSVLDPQQHASAAQPLPVGHRMGELEITGVLGIGGFGIVYRAWDLALQRVVAIKEYMPSMLAVRQGDLTVSLRGERFSATFQAGQAGFINEARLLAQFDHPGLIKVLRFWEDHGTAYMATQFYEGQTLKQRMAGGKALPEAGILRLMAALLGALETLHRAQCFHRDIALDNILIQPDGHPVLLDFGAARKLIGDMVDDSTVMLKPGYAPIEQYTDDPAFRQGPWTDVYALGAVIHVLVCGELPPAAVVRSIQDTYVPLQGRVISYSSRLLQAADQALSLRIEDRPQSVAAFATLLGLQSPKPGQYKVPEAEPATAPPAPVTLPANPARNTPPEPAGGEPTAFDLDAIAGDAPGGRDGGLGQGLAGELGDELALAAPPAALPEESAAAAPIPARANHRPVAPPPAVAVRTRPVWLWPVVGVAALVLIAGGAVLLWPKPAPEAPVVVATPTPVPTLAPTPVTTPEPTAAPVVMASDPAVSSDASAVAEASAPADAVVANPATPAPTASAADPAPAQEADDWKQARKRHTAAAYQRYLQQHPASSHDADAKRLLARATEREAAAPQIPLNANVPVQLRVQPWGEVYVGGVRRGISPPLKSLQLAPGTYDIEVRNGNLTPYRTRLVISPDAKGAEIAHSFE